MTRDELSHLLPHAAPRFFADVTYSKPTLHWLQGPFWKWFTSWRAEMGLNSWTRKNDCDNFARAYCQAVQDCHSLSSDPADNEGLAVGEFWYHAPLEDHAVVIAITDQGRIFLEPQNNRRLMLTQREIDSCFFVRF